MPEESRRFDIEYLLDHPELLKENEYIEARRVLQRKGRMATKEECDRMTYAVMMRHREEHISGSTLSEN